MKFRTDFVTNSSSTGYVVIQLTLENGEKYEKQADYNGGRGEYFRNRLDESERDEILCKVKNGEDLLDALRKMIVDFDQLFGKDVCQTISSLQTLEKANRLLIREQEEFEIDGTIEVDEYEFFFSEAANIQKKDIEDKEYAEILKRIKPLSMAQVGDSIIIGSYEQDNKSFNGKEDIEWLVLEKKEDRMLVISRYALDCQPYNKSLTDVTWETCSLRKWLNGTFINNAFNSVERAMIRNTKVKAHKNPAHHTSPGLDTTDKIFLLSIVEAHMYVPKLSRECEATAYAKAKGAKNINSDCIDWWLRTPGGYAYYAAEVDCYGYFTYIGGNVNSKSAVRPAMWISLKPGKDEEIDLKQHDRAMALIDSGDYPSAYALLKGLDYKDSAEILQSIEPQYKRIPMSEAHVGNYVVFGSYEQYNNTFNGKEDIEWLVLAKEEDRMLVISKYVLDCQPYNKSRKEVTWETSSLRKWLNETFINNAFSSDEQAMIQSTTVKADKNPEYDTPAGNNTRDKVFLLSITEADKYFNSDFARQCKATKYAEKRRVYTNEVGCCFWWLRSPGYDSDYAAEVDYDGFLSSYGDFVSRRICAIRPAMWINLRS